MDQCVKRACFFEHRKAKNDRTNAGAKLVDVSPVISAVDEESQPGINALLNPKIAIVTFRVPAGVGADKTTAYDWKRRNLV